MDLIIPGGHPLCQKEIIRLVDIAKYPHILLEKSAVTRRMVDDVYARNKIIHNVIIEADVIENIKSYVERGIGLGIVLSLSISPEDRRRFHVINVSKFFGKVEFGIFYKKEKYLSLAMRKFVELFAPEILISLHPEPPIP